METWELRNETDRTVSTLRPFVDDARTFVELVGLSTLFLAYFYKTESLVVGALAFLSWAALVAHCGMIGGAVLRHVKVNPFHRDNSTWLQKIAGFSLVALISVALTYLIINGARKLLDTVLSG
jgi:hypothetical protein